MQELCSIRFRCSRVCRKVLLQDHFLYLIHLSNWLPYQDVQVPCFIETNSNLLNTYRTEIRNLNKRFRGQLPSSNATLQMYLLPTYLNNLQNFFVNCDSSVLQKKIKRNFSTLEITIHNNYLAHSKFILSRVSTCFALLQAEYLKSLLLELCNAYCVPIYHS